MAYVLVGASLADAEAVGKRGTDVPPARTCEKFRAYGWAKKIGLMTGQTGTCNIYCISHFQQLLPVFFVLFLTPKIAFATTNAKQIATDAITEIFSKHNPEAVALYVVEDYVQHQPGIFPLSMDGYTQG